jgi:Leucine-rich repeat (LRR) protein
MLVNYRGRELTTFPEELIGNKLITYLNLDDNEITHLPAWITSLTGLKVLYLSNNLISDISLLAQIPTLEIVYLNQNRINVLPEDLGNLQQLKRLFLADNKLEALPESFYNLKELRMLTLKNNQIRNIDEKISRLHLLVNLNLDWNQLKMLPAGVGNLRELKKLIVSSNKLGSLPAEMMHLDALEELDLSNNKLTRIENLPHGFNKIEIYRNPLEYIDVNTEVVYYDASQTFIIKDLPGEHKLVNPEETDKIGFIFNPEMMRRKWEGPASEDY